MRCKLTMLKCGIFIFITLIIMGVFVYAQEILDQESWSFSDTFGFEYDVYGDAYSTLLEEGYFGSFDPFYKYSDGTFTQGGSSSVYSYNPGGSITYQDNVGNLYTVDPSGSVFSRGVSVGSIFFGGDIGSNFEIQHEGGRIGSIGDFVISSTGELVRKSSISSSSIPSDYNFYEGTSTDPNANLNVLYNPGGNFDSEAAVAAQSGAQPDAQVGFSVGGRIPNVDQIPDVDQVAGSLLSPNVLGFGYGFNTGEKNEPSFSFNIQPSSRDERVEFGISYSLQPDTSFSAQEYVYGLRGQISSLQAQGGNEQLVSTLRKASDSVEFVDTSLNNYREILFSDNPEKARTDAIQYLNSFSERAQIDSALKQSALISAGDLYLEKANAMPSSAKSFSPPPSLEVPKYPIEYSAYLKTLDAAKESYEKAYNINKDPYAQLRLANTWLLDQEGGALVANRHYREIVLKEDAPISIRTAAYAGIALSEISKPPASSRPSDIVEAYKAIEAGKQLNPSDQSLINLQNQLDKIIFKSVFNGLQAESDQMLNNLEAKLGVQGYSNNGFWQKVHQSLGNTFNIFEGSLGGEAQELTTEFEGKAFSINAQQIGIMTFLAAIEKGIDPRRLASSDYNGRVQILTQEAGFDEKIASDIAYSTLNAQRNPDIALALANGKMGNAALQLQKLGFSTSDLAQDLSSGFKFSTGEGYINPGALKTTWFDGIKKELNIYNVLAGMTGAYVAGTLKSAGVSFAVIGGNSIALPAVTGAAESSTFLSKIPTLRKVGGFIGGELREEATEEVFSLGLDSILSVSGAANNPAAVFLAQFISPGRHGSVAGNLLKTNAQEGVLPTQVISLSNGEFLPVFSRADLDSVFTNGEVPSIFDKVGAVAGKGDAPSINIYEAPKTLSGTTSYDFFAVAETTKAEVETLPVSSGDSISVTIKAESESLPAKTETLKVESVTAIDQNEIADLVNKEFERTLQNGPVRFDNNDPAVQEAVAQATAESIAPTNPNLVVRDAVKNARIEGPDNFMQMVDEGGVYIGKLTVQKDIGDSTISLPRGRGASVNIEMRSGYKGAGGATRFFDEMEKSRILKDVDYVASYLNYDNEIVFDKIAKAKMSADPSLSRQNALIVAAKEYPTGKLWTKYGYTPAGVIERANAGPVIIWQASGKTIEFSLTDATRISSEGSYLPKVKTFNDLLTAIDREIARAKSTTTLDEKMRVLDRIDAISNREADSAFDGLQDNAKDLATLDEKLDALDNVKKSILENLKKTSPVSSNEYSAVKEISAEHNLEPGNTKFFDIQDKIKSEDLRKVTDDILSGYLTPEEKINGKVFKEGRIFVIDEPGNERGYPSSNKDFDYTSQDFGISRGIKKEVVINLAAIRKYGQKLVDDRIISHAELLNTNSLMVESIVYHEKGHELFKQLPEKYRGSLVNTIINHPEFNKWANNIKVYCKFDCVGEITNKPKVAEELIMIATQYDYIIRNAPFTRKDWIDLSKPKLDNALLSYAYSDRADLVKINNLIDNVKDRFTVEIILASDSGSGLVDPDASIISINKFLTDKKIGKLSNVEETEVRNLLDVVDKSNLPLGRMGDSIFYHYDYDNSPALSQGIKLHIGDPGTPAERAQVLKELIDVITDIRYDDIYDVSFKVALVPRALGDSIQQGKFITLYPKSAVQAQTLASRLDSVYQNKQYSNLISPPADIAFGNSKLVTWRFGQFKKFPDQSNPKDNLIKVNGDLIADNRRDAFANIDVISQDPEIMQQEGMNFWISQANEQRKNAPIVKNEFADSELNDVFETDSTGVQSPLRTKECATDCTLPDSAKLAEAKRELESSLELDDSSQQLADILEVDEMLRNNKLDPNEFFRRLELELPTTSTQAELNSLLEKKNQLLDKLLARKDKLTEGELEILDDMLTFPSKIELDSKLTELSIKLKDISKERDSLNDKLYDVNNENMKKLQTKIKEKEKVIEEKYRVARKLLKDEYEKKFDDSYYKRASELRSNFQTQKDEIPEALQLKNIAKENEEIRRGMDDLQKERDLLKHQINDLLERYPRSDPYKQTLMKEAFDIIKRQPELNGKIDISSGSRQGDPRGPGGTYAGYFSKVALDNGADAVAFRPLSGSVSLDIARTITLIDVLNKNPATSNLMPKVLGIMKQDGLTYLIMEKLPRVNHFGRRSVGSFNNVKSEFGSQVEEKMRSAFAPDVIKLMEKYGLNGADPGRVLETDYMFVDNNGQFRYGVPVRADSFLEAISNGEIFTLDAEAKDALSSSVILGPISKLPENANYQYAREFLNTMNIENKGVLAMPFGNLPARNADGQILTIWSEALTQRQMIGFGEEGVDFVKLMQDDTTTKQEFLEKFGEYLLDNEGKPIVSQSRGTGNTIKEVIGKINNLVLGITGKSIFDIFKGKDETARSVNEKGFIALCEFDSCQTLPTLINDRVNILALGIEVLNGKLDFGYHPLVYSSLDETEMEVEKEQFFMSIRGTRPITDASLILNETLQGITLEELKKEERRVEFRDYNLLPQLDFLQLMTPQPLWIDIVLGKDEVRGINLSSIDKESRKKILIALYGNDKVKSNQFTSFMTRRYNTAKTIDYSFNYSILYVENLWGEPELIVYKYYNSKTNKQKSVRGTIQLPIYYVPFLKRDISIPVVENQCLNGIKEAREECDLVKGSLENNPYCAQSTETVVSGQTMKRDSQGSCTLSCKCAYDSFKADEQKPANLQGDLCKTNADCSLVKEQCVNGQCLPKTYCGDGIVQTINDDGIDEECDFSTTVSSVLYGLNDKGQCKLGVATCTRQCKLTRNLNGLVLPDISETMGDGIDNNCNGNTDEDLSGGSQCGAGRTQPCGVNVGQCKEGIQRCFNVGHYKEIGQWGECEGEIGPQPEMCDGLDNNCNGLADEGFLNKSGVCLGESGQIITPLDTSKDLSEGIIVYRSEFGDGPYAPVAILPLSAKSYIESNLPASDYYYKLRMFNGSVLSSFTNYTKVKMKDVGTKFVEVGGSSIWHHTIGNNSLLLLETPAVVNANVMTIELDRLCGLIRDRSGKYYINISTGRANILGSQYRTYLHDKELVSNFDRGKTAKFTPEEKKLWELATTFDKDSDLYWNEFVSLRPEFRNYGFVEFPTERGGLFPRYTFSALTEWKRLQVCGNFPGYEGSCLYLAGVECVFAD